MKVNIEKAFEKAWKEAGYHEPKYCDSHSVKSFKEGFQAAYSQLMPIIEKQNEALEYIAKTDIICSPDEPNILWLGKWRNDRKMFAQETLKQVEDELKSLTDTSLHSEKLAGDGGEG